MKSSFNISFLLHTSLLLLTLASCRSSKQSKLDTKNSFEYVYDSISNRDSIEVVNIKKYNIYIDSLIKYDEHYEYIMSGIEEGKIKRETRRVKTNTYTDDLDTTIKIKNGGFGKYTYGNRKGDTLYKIYYHDNIDKNYYEYFYFRNNQLVSASIVYEENSSTKVFYSREEYYSESRTLKVEESKKKIATVYRERVSIDLRKKGIRYLSEYKEMNKDFLSQQ
ncbi:MULTISPECIES: hypothetical protein [unclassified Paraflavitalea]|uniref:hypothetical protein n=1 Tax=unclassified Paraflavitalea TaxID=2798305 RepID=UPI003D327A32